MYKGVFFEGEKYIFFKDYLLFIYIIFVWIEFFEKLKYFFVKDFENIEEKVLECYLNCKIDWDQFIKFVKKVEEC